MGTMMKSQKTPASVSPYTEIKKPKLHGWAKLVAEAKQKAQQQALLNQSPAPPASPAPVLSDDSGEENSNVKKKGRGKASLKVKGGGTGDTGGTGLNV